MIKKDLFSYYIYKFGNSNNEADMLFFKIFLLFSVCLLFLPSCINWGILDGLGNEELVTQRDEKKSNNSVQDDKIEDKKPLYAAKRTVTEGFCNYCSVKMNKSETVTSLDISPFEGNTAFLKDKLFRNRAAALSQLNALPDIDFSGSCNNPDLVKIIPSLEVVNGTLKPFNDGLYAATETAAESGITASGFPSKNKFFIALLARLTAMREGLPAASYSYFSDAAADIAAAVILIGEIPTADDSIKAEAQSRANDFSASFFGKPISFYTWNGLLSKIFTRDRYLQNYRADDGETVPDPFGGAELGKMSALALAINSDEALRADYDAILMLYRGLTNPYADIPVTVLLECISDTSALENIQAVSSCFLSKNNTKQGNLSACRPHFAVLPASESKETTYFEDMFCDVDQDISNVNYLETLINAIKNGKLNLAPDSRSGWYDYQSWALETLLLPERAEEKDHLLLSAAYKKKLEDTFKSIIIQNRETHAKQLKTGTAASTGIEMPPTKVYPNLPAEPFPTFYIRTARAYRFLDGYLRTVLGAGALESMARMNEDGIAQAEKLSDELKAKAELLYGLYYMTSDVLGSSPQLLADEAVEYNEKNCRDRAWTWIHSWQKDKDVLKDPRVIVPVQIDITNNESISWAVLGIRAIKIKAEFVSGHEPEIISASCGFERFIPKYFYLLVESTAEVRRPLSTPPLDRDEFRAICDKYDNAADIISAIGGK